jgi:hypothetical protein
MLIALLTLYFDKDPCLTNPCGGNRKCTPIAATGGRNCTCEKNFIEKNGTCAPVPPGKFAYFIYK